MNDQAILDIVSTILRVVSGPLLEIIEGMVKGEKARRVESIRPLTGESGIAVTLRDIDKGPTE